MSTAAVAQRQRGRRPLDDADVRLVGVHHATARLGQQRRVGLDAVGPAGAARQQHRVVPDPGADVGDALSATARRSSRARRAPCAPGRWRPRAARGAPGRTRSRREGSGASGHLHAQLRGRAAVEGEQVVAGQQLEVERHGSGRRAASPGAGCPARLRQQRPPADRDGAGGLALLARAPRPTSSSPGRAAGRRRGSDPRWA